MTWRDSPIWAAHLALRGKPLFPLRMILDGACTCSEGAACTVIGKHPVHKARAPGDPRWGASADPEVIAGWARRYSRNGVGLPTGPDSGILVLDVDGQAGRDSLRRIEEQHGPLPVTWRTERGLGGHTYFACPSEPWATNTARVLGPGLDTRGAGGMVVVPPSPHKSGTPYRWAHGRGPGDVQLAPPPAWIAVALQHHHERYRRPAPSGPLPEIGRDARTEKAARYLARIPGVAKGCGRDPTTYKLACTMVGFGLSEPEALVLLSTWGERCDPPWGRAELEVKVAHAFRYAREEPGARLAWRPTRRAG